MTESTTEQNNNPEPDKSYSKEQYDGLKSNLVNEIRELKGQLDIHSKEREERAAKDSEIETQRLKANDDYKAIIEKNQAEYQAKEDEYKANQTQLQNQFTSLQQDNALVKSGITDEIQILGLKAKYQGTDDAPDFADWLASQDLVSKDNGRSSGNAGNVSTKPNDTLEQRLNSGDPAIKTAALMEQLKASTGF